MSRRVSPTRCRGFSSLVACLAQDEDALLNRYRIILSEEITLRPHRDQTLDSSEFTFFAQLDLIREPVFQKNRLEMSQLGPGHYQLTGFVNTYYDMQLVQRLMLNLPETDTIENLVQIR